MPHWFYPCVCVVSVLQGSHVSWNCYSDWLRLSLYYLHFKLRRLREVGSRPCILSLASKNHAESRMVKPEPYRNTCFSNCKGRKVSLGVHYVLLVFTQNNSGFNYTVNYVCLNIKNKIPNSESIKLTLHKKFLMIC